MDKRKSDFSSGGDALDQFLKKHKIKKETKVTSSEGNLQNKAIEYLKSLKSAGHSIVWNKRWSGGIYQRSGFPDLEVWYRGKHVDIELKDLAKVTPLQQEKIDAIKATGNLVYVVNNLAEFKEIINSL